MGPPTVGFKDSPLAVGGVAEVILTAAVALAGLKPSSSLNWKESVP